MKHIYYINNPVLISRFLSEYKRRKDSNLNGTCIYTFHGAKHKESANKIIQEGFRLPTDPVVRELQKGWYKYIGSPSGDTGIFSSEFIATSVDYCYDIDSIKRKENYWRPFATDNFKEEVNEDQWAKLFICMALVGDEKKHKARDGYGSGFGYDTANFEKGTELVMFDTKCIIPLYQIVFDHLGSNGVTSSRIIARVPWPQSKRIRSTTEVQNHKRLC